jgi:hypothetical protein
MKFKVISMTDNNYFDCGKLFIKTRKNVNADFKVYSPDLSKKNIKILKDNNIDHFKISKSTFDKYMQYLKIKFLKDEIFFNQINKPEDRFDMITFVDFDTFVINDWCKKVYSKDFDIGYTFREDMIKKKCLRAMTNGGVIFAKNSSYQLLKKITDIIMNGKNDNLKEYDEIWKTLEDEKRPEHKRHYRTNLRWWVDQIISSAFLYQYLKNNKLEKEFFNYNFNYDNLNIKIGFFNCNKFNVLDSNPIIIKEKDIYIRHLKHNGRIKLIGKDIVKEKI